MHLLVFITALLVRTTATATATSKMLPPRVPTQHAASDGSLLSPTCSGTIPDLINVTGRYGSCTEGRTDTASCTDGLRPLKAANRVPPPGGCTLLWNLC